MKQNLRRYGAVLVAAVALAGGALVSVPAAAAGGDNQHGAGRYHYRQQGYVNQDGYTTENIYKVENLAYYGDWDSNRVFVIDVDSMALLTTVEGTGDGPYGIDQEGVTKAYALTRKTESLTIVDNTTFENAGQIPLQHKPRSTNYNADTDLTLVSGADKAMTSIIRVARDQVKRVVGYDELSEPTDFGGSLATGHPLWLNDKRFFMLDRAARQIQLWNRHGELLSTLATPTSVHHLFQPPADSMEAGDKAVFYAVAEGNQQKGLSPAILRFEVRGKRLVRTGNAVLSHYDPQLLDPAVMGAHHADFHPDGVHIYIGSAEGHLFVVNKDTMAIETMIDTGPGSGHTTFVPTHNLAIVTNHHATYMTAIDTSTHRWLKNIEVADSALPDYKSQSHTSGVSLDMKYFYSAASHDGVFFRIDLETLVVSDRLYLGGNVLMGSFIWNGDGVNM